MLDETTCPVCGQLLWERGPKKKVSVERAEQLGIWAVAHYLAHLVQQNDAPMARRRAARDLAMKIGFGLVHGVDKKKNLPR